MEDLREEFKQQLAASAGCMDTQDTCGQRCPCVKSCSNTLGEVRRLVGESEVNRDSALAHKVSTQKIVHQVRQDVRKAAEDRDTEALREQERRQVGQQLAAQA